MLYSISFCSNGFNDCSVIRDLMSVQCAIITQIVKS